MTTETSIVAAIRKYLKSIGAKTYKTHGGPVTRAGTPDILGCYAGLLLALEVKLPGQKLTRIQEKELQDWKKAGALTGRVESVEDVMKLLGDK